MATTNHTQAQKAEAGRQAVGKDGRQIAKIAKRMGVAPTTVYWWRKRFAGTPEAIAASTGASVAGITLNGAPIHPAAARSYPTGTRPNGQPGGEVMELIESITTIENTLAKFSADEQIKVLDYVRSRLLRGAF